MFMLLIVLFIFHTERSNPYFISLQYVMIQNNTAAAGLRLTNVSHACREP